MKGHPVGLENRRLQPLGPQLHQADMPDAGASRKRQIRGWGIREPFYDSRQRLHSRPGFPNPCFAPNSGVAASDLSAGANAPPHSACPARGFIAYGIRFPAAGRLGAVRVAHSLPIVRCDRAERLAPDSIYGLEVWRSAVVFRRTGIPCLQHKGFHDHARGRSILLAAQGAAVCRLRKVVCAARFGRESSRLRWKAVG